VNDYWGRWDGMEKNDSRYIPLALNVFFCTFNILEKEKKLQMEL
jgi:hypothetical protein